MAIRLNKPWQPLTEGLALLHGHMGVFELADAEHQIIYIGYAGGKSLFGLHGEVLSASQQVSEAAFLRIEITTAYLSRFRELMMVHIADHGAPPVANPPINLGKLSPAG